MSKLTFNYRFKRADRTELIYSVVVDSETLNVLTPDHDNEPDWTLLEYNQCDHCPLNKEDSPRCPVAKNLHRLLTTFEKTQSIDIYEVQVETPERIYTKNTDIQNSLGSLFGLIMATSSCPTMSFLKPMARFHLPFSTIEETIFRSLGSFLISKYLEKNTIDKTEVNNDLTENYKLVNAVNRNLIARIQHLINKKTSGDADQNAIVILDTLAVLLTMELGQNVDLISKLYHLKKSERKPS